MEQFEISAAARDDKGKGASRRLRRTGYVPGILYGAGKDPVNIQLEHNDVMKHTDIEAFYSHILTLRLPGGNERVVLKDLQRHPFKAQVMHMDFLRITENETLTMRIPLHFVNEETCLGVKAGGIVYHLITELEITCLPRDLPEYIEIDVAALNIGDSLHLSDIVVPPGVEIDALAGAGDDEHADQPVVSVEEMRVMAEPEEGAPEDAPEVSVGGVSPAQDDDDS
jgi:large subunit ribosomal protein L25